MKIHKSIEQLPAFKNAVITLGTFDGVHHGHKKLAKKIIALAKELKGESIIVTFDPHPRSIIYPKDKSLKLLSTLDEKLALFEELGIDHVVVVPFTFEFSQMSAKEYVEKFIITNFNPSCLVIGYDHKFGLNRQGDFSLLKMYEAEGHFKLEKVEKQELEEITISSTKIRNAINTGAMQEAGLLLGYNYQLTGEVVHGDKLGTKIGFPTANLLVKDEKKIVPVEGIYAARMRVDGVEGDCMVYIGRRPTIDNNLEKTIEVNIFDFNSNIYSKDLTLEFIEFIRGDQKFDSLELLTNQLKLDKIRTLEILNNQVQVFEKPECAVAILSYNNSEFLQSYLPVIGEFTGSNAKIHVIDNHSQDDTSQILTEWFPEINLIELTKNYGFAEGYNRGIKILDEQYIVLLNSDVLVTENWLDPLLDKLKSDPSIGAVMPKILSLENQDEFEYAGASGGYIDSLGYPFCRGRVFDKVEKDEGQYDDEQEVFWTSGAAMVLRKDTFVGLGGFDNSFFAHQEEIDLCWRMKRAGLKCMVVPSAKVYHFGGGSLSYQSPNKTYLNFRNNLTTIIKNEPYGKLLWLLPIRFVLDGVAGVKFLLTGKPIHTWSIVKAHLSLYVRVFKIFRRKRQEKKFIAAMRKGPERKSGRLKGSIIWKYFVGGKSKFSDII